MLELFIGILLGIVFTVVVVRRSKSGVLRICITDDPEEPPYWFVDLTRSMESICEKKQVLFTVDVKHIRTQK